MASHLIFLGAYTRTTSKGIYAVRLDDATGALSAPVLVAETANPTWVTLTPDKKFLYAVNASQAQAVGYRVDPAGPKLTPLPRSSLASTQANQPAHLAVDGTGRVLLAANYADGYVAAMSIHADGSLGAPNVVRHSGHSLNPQRQDKPHPHSVIPSPDNRYVLVCDLGLDKIFTYSLDREKAQLMPANPPFIHTTPTLGPRHLKFGPDGKHAYCITEMGATIEVFDYDAARGALSPLQSIPTLPSDYQARWGAEVRIHPNGKFLYGSNRGHDSIAVYALDPSSGKLTLIEIVPTGGKVPRNFSLSPDGQWLLCGHQDSDTITEFRVDSATGRLTRTPHTANVAHCICVLFYD